jgi:hypothetical protein
MRFISLKNLSFYVFFSILSACYSCQKDIPVLGEDAVDTGQTNVYINSIVLRSFPSIDPSTMLPWDDGSIQVFDSTDSVGPDIFYSYYYKSDVLPPMYYSQDTHFQDITPLPADSPLVYFLTDPALILPEYIDTTFYLKVNDLDLGTVNDTNLIDSIPFAITNDHQITSVTGTGFNGTVVTLGLQWK